MLRLPKFMALLHGFWHVFSYATSPAASAKTAGTHGVFGEILLRQERRTHSIERINKET